MGYKVKGILIFAIFIIFIFFTVGTASSANNNIKSSTIHKESIESDHGHHDDHLDGEADSTDEIHDHDEHDMHDEDENYLISEDEDHGEDDHADGAIELSNEQRKQINLKLEKAGSGSLFSELSLMGETKLNGDLLAHVIPKMPGVVLDVKVSLGDNVKLGQVLATIESVELAKSKADYLEKLRQFEITKKVYKRKKYLHEEKIASKASLLEKEAEFLNAETALKTARSMLMVSGLTKEAIQALPKATDAGFGHYQFKAPISGTIIEKHITIGEKLNSESEVFTISDLNSLWVDLSIPARDIYQVKQGSDVTIHSSHGMKAAGTISLVGPIVDENTRTGLARLILDNRNDSWKPGLFVTGHIRISALNLPVVVDGEAVQNIEGEDMVFIQDGDIFEPVPVVTGRRDRSRVEITSGLKPGTIHVTQGAFELKAIMITSGMGSHAGHGH